MTSDVHPADQVLIAFNSGRLNDSEAAAVRRHLKNCRDCRRRLSSLPAAPDGRRSPERETDRLAGVTTPRAPANAVQHHAVPNSTEGTTSSRRSFSLIAAGAGGAIAVGLAGALIAWAAGTFQGAAPATQRAVAQSGPALSQPVQKNTDRSSQFESSGQTQAPAKTTASLPAVGAAQPDTRISPAGKLAENPPPKLEKPVEPLGRVTAAVPSKQALVSKGKPERVEQPNLPKDQSASFFNNQDLAGWQGSHDIWHVENGSIIAVAAPGHDQPSFLSSQRTYKDFDLRFQISADGGMAECGVLFRSQLVGAASNEVAGPECAIYGKDAPKGHVTGSLVTEPGGKVEKAAPAKLVERYVKPNENHFRIRCQGKHVLIEVNGLKTVNADFPTLPEEGVIAWKIDGKRPPQKLSIKMIQFTDLTSSPSAPASREPLLANLELLKAEIKFEKAITHADEALLKHFDSELNKLKHNSHAHENELTGAVERERAAFKEKGLIPWSRPMRKWLLEYAKEIATAHRTVGIAFDKAIDRAEKNQSEKEKEALVEEAARILAPRPVAIWQLTGPRRTRRMVLFSDSTLVLDDREDESSSRFWAPPYEDKIVVELPAKGDPTIAMTQVFELEPDGSALIGLTKNGQKQVWQRVEE